MDDNRDIHSSVRARIRALRSSFDAVADAARRGGRVQVVNVMLDHADALAAVAADVEAGRMARAHHGSAALFNSVARHARSWESQADRVLCRAFTKDMARAYRRMKDDAAEIKADLGVMAADGAARARHFMIG